MGSRSYSAAISALTFGVESDIVSTHGELSERFKELVLKTSDSERNLGFESLTLRQKRSNFCLPKVTSFFIQAAGLAYHHDAVVYIISPFGAVSHHASACILLRLDEMQHCVLMICNSCGIDDIQGFALICLWKSNIILLKGVVICRKIIC